MVFENKISIMGAGAWGTGLAVHCAKMGLSVKLWCYEPELAEQINSKHFSSYLPGVLIPDNVVATSDYAELMEFSSLILECVPSFFLYETMKRFLPYYRPNYHSFVITTKGIDPLHNSLPVDLLLDLFNAEGFLPPENIAVLSGANIPSDIASGKFAAAIIAGQNTEMVRAVSSLLASPSFFIEESVDPIGVQICGAFKNIIALAYGICKGAGFSEGFAAFMFTKGLEEISAVLKKFGCNPNTAYRICGLGDMFLTATTEHKNAVLGGMLGRGYRLEEARQLFSHLPEGITSINPAIALAQNAGVKVPVAKAVSEFIFTRCSPSEFKLKILQNTI